MGKCRRQETQVRKIPWNRKRQPTRIFLPGKFYGRRRLAGEESDTYIYIHIYEAAESDMTIIYIYICVKAVEC